jgi:methyltransferase (TIGR00027 family)
VKGGTASRTARGVAAYRLSFDRAAAPYGDPRADEALTRDVADGLDRPPGSPMHDYLRARTEFFDDVTVRSIDAGISQVVLGAAGYDGRALRYAKPGVRWFEVDHPDTQADKLERLARLGLNAGHVRFISADFATDPITGPLLDAGFDPAMPALFLLEGVAVYLDLPILTRVLRAFRAIAADGSPLAISFSVGAASAERRQRFQERVAELGEPVRTVLTADAAGALLASAGWTPAQPGADGADAADAADAADKAVGAVGGERQRSAGLLLARA